MRFPRRAGFTAAREVQASDTFSRAVLAGALVDALPYLAPRQRETLSALVVREAERVWASRVPGMQCPFRYFSGLPELPPDADTLAAAVLLLSWARPEWVDELAPAIEAMEEDIAHQGWVRTWQIADADTPATRDFLSRAVASHWGEAFDVGVNARVALALAALGRQKAARTLARSLITRQANDGTFTPRWYAGTILGTALCLSALSKVLPHAPAVEAARNALLALQREDGGWGTHRSEPLPTACALRALGTSTRQEVVDNGVQFLLDHQRRDGAWNESAWIAMPIRASADSPFRVASFGSRSVTTAFVVRALSVHFLRSDSRSESAS
jgi:squalene-hopene/tetraprenyl-beta-curcumene cyclase